jgi:hypothetical protein
MKTGGNNPMDASIALKVVVTNQDAPKETVLHEAVLMAGRLATSVVLHYQGLDYLIHPYDNCPEGCPQCADRNPNLKPKHRDLCWGNDD